MRSVYAASRHRRSVLAAALWPRTWCILLLVIVGGQFFADQLWLLGHGWCSRCGYVPSKVMENQ